MEPGEEEMLVYDVQVSDCHLKAVIEEEQGDIFTTVTWLVTQGNGFNPVYQTTMRGQKISLQREMGKGTRQSESERMRVLLYYMHVCKRSINTSIHR